jgi:pyrroloquinoline quinone (PQQ) biosynthesis protein C
MNDELAGQVERLVVDRWFADAPPLIVAMAGRPTPGVTKAFVLQWTKFSRLFPRWVGAIIANCPQLAVIAYEVENLMSEVVRDPAGDDNHYELLIRLGAGVGLSRQEIEGWPALPEAEELFSWLWHQARDQDWLTGFTAVNGLEILGDGNLAARYGIQQGTGLAPGPYASALGLEAGDLEFFEVSDQADAGHGRETVRLIARYCPPGAEHGVLAVLEESMARLRRMMDATWRLAGRLDSVPVAGEVT